MGADEQITEDGILGNRLRVRQPLRGHRVGHDAIILAAATGGRAGEEAIDLGSGVGAAGLALAARIPGLKVTLVEIDWELSVLSAENARLNGLQDRVRALALDVENLDTFEEAGLSASVFDRVLMNPPFHDAHRQNVSPDPRRRLAHMGRPGLLRQWIGTAQWLLKPRGVLTLIWRADGLPEVLNALGPAFGDIAVLPLLPREGAQAIRIIVRAVKGANGPSLTHPPLVLNDALGQPTDAAEAILRRGNTLNIAKL